MRIALIGLAALLPALASADDASPAPYVLHQGRAVRSEAGAPPSAAPSSEESSAVRSSRGVSIQPVSNFSGAPVRTSIVGGRSSSFTRSTPAARAFRGGSPRRGIAGAGGTAADSAPPAYAVPGAKIISAGQQPVYSEAAGGGTHSVEGGGFIAMDQAKAHDVGRAPGITWAPPDTPPGRNPQRSGGGGSGASANGPAPSGSGTSGGTATGGGGNTGNDNGNGSGQGDNGNGVGGNGNGSGNNGNGQLDNSTGFNPAF